MNTQRKFEWYIMLFILCTGFITTPLKSIAEQNKPNIVFIAVDDLRPTLGSYGDTLAITPNIDRLAEEGVLFNRAYVQQAVCSPSRTSMLTGLRPDEVNVTDMNTYFRDNRPNVITLPQQFKMGGYNTVGIGKVFHYSPGMQDPDSWTVQLYETNHGRKNDQYVLEKNKGGGKAEATENADVRDDAYLDGKFSSLAIDFLRKYQDSKKPFFLAVGFLKPHLPFAAPKKYWDWYNRENFKPIRNAEKPIDAPEIAFHDNNELRGYTDIPDIGEGAIPETKKMELRHGYYAAVSFIDTQVGKILDTLENLDMRENTIIVLWGDHGFHLGEQTLWAKSTNFELDTRAPLIISAPGISKAGMESNAIVESLDVYPTLMDLCKIDPKMQLSGISLKPLLMNPTKDWDKIAYSQFPRPYSAVGNSDKMTHMGYSVRTNQWRYTVWYNIETGLFEYPELYSMKGSNDVESKNLAGKEKYIDVEKHHQQLIQKYVEKFK